MNSPETTPKDAPKPPADLSKWHRWFAVECNNAAWNLVENADRTPEQTREMLDAAHSSAFHWRSVGTPLNVARAEMLLAAAHAIARSPRLAKQYADSVLAYFTANPCPDWEIAFAYSVSAAAARAMRDDDLYRKYHAEAQRLCDLIADPTDKEIFLRTFAQLPDPATI